jgi:ABC-type sugar transport system substrate-binding protein
MKKLKFVVSLTNDDNDYQIEQAAAAEDAARRLGLDLELIHADNDSIKQSQQLLQRIQCGSAAHPDAILFEPAGGTALPQVARAAAAAGIGWAVLNREVNYLAELRKTSQAPAFSVTSNHEEIGRIQGRQIGLLLPNGGTVLYIQGPAENSAAKERTAGMYEVKPVSVQVKQMRAQWTEASAYKVVHSWLRLSTSQSTSVDMVAAQDDSMAMGARKAFQEVLDTATRERWLRLPLLGCDGLPGSGQTWVRQGLLTATIYVPPNAGQAMEMMAKAIHGGAMPEEKTLTTAVSYPSLDKLAPNDPDSKTFSAFSR